jgi:hypothetical protein
MSVVIGSTGVPVKSARLPLRGAWPVGVFTAEDVRAVLREPRDLVQLIGQADRIERAALYQALNLSLRYERKAATGQELVHVRSQRCRGGGWI